MKGCWSWEQSLGDAAEEVHIVRGDTAERPEIQFTVLQPQGIILLLPTQ